MSTFNKLIIIMIDIDGAFNFECCFKMKQYELIKSPSGGARLAFVNIRFTICFVEE